jgi:hypothetical protein
MEMLWQKKRFWRFSVWVSVQAPLTFRLFVVFLRFSRYYYYLLLLLVGWDWVSGYCGHYWPIIPAPDDRWGWLWKNWRNKDWQGKPKYWKKTCPSATLSTTNPTWLYPGFNPDRRGGKPATNRLSYGGALCLLQVDAGIVTRNGPWFHASLFDSLYPFRRYMTSEVDMTISNINNE